MKGLLAVLTGFVATVACALPVTLTWDSPSGATPTGYVIGYGEASGQYTTTVDVGNTRVYQIPDLIAGHTYYLSVTAYDAIASSAWATEIVVAPLSFGSPSPATISPVGGLWGNPDESGSGYTLDYKHGVLVVLVFSYTSTGESQWYIASGAINGTIFTSHLDKFRNGQCISCEYAGSPSYSGSDGTITIEFSSQTSATAHLPGGRVTHIAPVAF